MTKLSDKLGTDTFLYESDVNALETAGALGAGRAAEILA